MAVEELQKCLNSARADRDDLADALIQKDCEVQYLLEILDGR